MNDGYNVLESIRSNVTRHRPRKLNAMNVKRDPWGKRDERSETVVVGERREE